MNDTSPEGPLPPSLRLLKWLVIVLTATMIAGVITVVALLVTRMPDGSPRDWPETLALPGGAVPEAVTRGRDFIAVVTTDGRVMILNPDGSLRQEIQVEPGP